MKVNIVDVSVGNRKSVENWLRRSNIHCMYVRKPSDYQGGPIILPGVTSAGIYMQKLKESGIDALIHEAASKDERIVGICAGFQVLTDYSLEDSGVDCLGIIPGKTFPMTELGFRFEFNNGWDDICIDSRKIRDFEQSNAFLRKPLSHRKKVIRGRVYFNHKFGVKLDQPSDYETGKIDGCGAYSFAIRGNIFGFQFHPEKSQLAGVNILDLIV